MGHGRGRDHPGVRGRRLAPLLPRLRRHEGLLLLRRRPPLRRGPRPEHRRAPAPPPRPARAARSSHPPPNAGATGDLAIGRWSSSYFDGKIDGVAVYDVALNQAEVDTVYGATTLAPTDYVREGGLVARYALDGGAAADGVGSNDGTVYGASYAVGHDGGGALAFDGTDDYVELPAAVTATIGGNSARTVCLWAKINSFDNGGLFGYGTPVNGVLEDFALRAMIGDFFRVQIWNADIDATIAGSTDGAWHHYCLAYDGGLVALYFDGSLAASDYKALATTLADNLKLGLSTSNSYFDGALDDVRIYDVGLDAAEVARLYRAGDAAAFLEGGTAHAGTVVAYSSHHAAWGHACDDGWDVADGTVVCRDAFGSSYYAASVAHGSFYQQPGSRAILFDAVQCAGSEATLDACAHATTDDCGAWEHAGVVCASPSAVLVGGPSPHEGRVLVHNPATGTWGSVCDDSWDVTDGTVLCRMLFGDAYAATAAPSQASYGSDAAYDFVYDDVACAGTEANLHACAHSATHNCAVGSDEAGVKCEAACEGLACDLVLASALEGGAAADAAGSNAGTVHGATATTGPDGSGALEFDGTDDYVEFPAAVIAGVRGAAPRSICAWARIDAFDFGGLFGYGTTSHLEDFSLRTADHGSGSFRMQFYGTDVDITISGAADGTWRRPTTGSRLSSESRLVFTQQRSRRSL